MATSYSTLVPPTFKHGPGPRMQIEFAGWSKEFAVPASVQEAIVRAARTAHRITGQIQDLVESQVSETSAIKPKGADLHDEVARMQDEGGNASGAAPYLKRAQ